MIILKVEIKINQRVNVSFERLKARTKLEIHKFYKIQIKHKYSLIIFYITVYKI